MRHLPTEPNSTGKYKGRFIHTYVGDGNPIPSFEGEPEKVTIKGDIEQLALTLGEVRAVAGEHGDLETLVGERPDDVRQIFGERARPGHHRARDNA